MGPSISGEPSVVVCKKSTTFFFVGSTAGKLTMMARLIKLTVQIIDLLSSREWAKFSS